jgi:hypothetical protein
VQIVEIDMRITFNDMVDGVPVCDLAKPGPRVLGKRMEPQAISSNREEL